MQITSFKQKIALVVFGSLLFLILLETGLRLAGFIFSSLQELRNMASIRRGGEYRIMCLGESTTALGGDNSYPSQLETILNKRNIGIKFSVINKGVCGIKTAGIASELDSNIDKYNPNMVLTMIGVNDRDAVCLPRLGAQESKKKKFLESLKTYKLFRLLRLHIMTRLKEYKTRRINKKILTNNRTAEIAFKNLPALESENNTASFELGWRYVKKHQYPQAEASFKRSLKFNPNNEKAYVGLASVYSLQGQTVQAEAAYKKAIELKPKDVGVYLAFGDYYYDRYQYTEAEIAYKKALELNPSSFWAYLNLAWCYNAQNQCPQAEAAFKKAIEVNPGGAGAYINLARFYNDRSQYPQAEAAFKKALELNPDSEISYCGLGWCSYYLGKYLQAEAAFKGALEINPHNDEASGGLATTYMQMGNLLDAEKYYIKANELRLAYYNPDTVYNYKEIKRITDKRKIQLVCVQYPMRSVEPLKKIFEGKEGVFFVDNEKIFKEAVQKGRYEDYFDDIFGGDFGHCNAKGNRMLAENIANVILKEVFHK